MRVIDLMTPDVVTIGADDTLKEAARRMVQNRISGLPVVDEDGRLIGIVTEADFLRQEMEREGLESAGWLSAVFGDAEAHDEAVTVGEVMSRDVITVLPDGTLAEAARLMAAHAVRRLPVISGEGQLLGILSRADVVAAFARPDEVIEDEIREDVARRVLFIDPDTLDIVVKDGVVKLRGELPSRSDARMLEELTRRLDGVVRVNSSLRWVTDDRTVIG